MIYLLYGQPGSGKTVLAKLLAEHLDTPFIIDGDEFRGMFNNNNYQKDGREENIRNANAVATYLNKKSKSGNWTAIYCRGDNGLKGRAISKGTHVIMSMVSPYSLLRNELKNNNKDELVQIFLHTNRTLRQEYHTKEFEVDKPDIILNTDKETEKTWEELKSHLKI